MTHDLAGAIELLDAALWDGLLEPGQALVIKDLKPKQVQDYLARHLADPRVAGLKAKTGKLDARKAGTLSKTWLAALPDQLERRAARGEVLAFELPAKKPVRGWLLTPAGARAAGLHDLDAQIKMRCGALELALAELDRHHRALTEVVAKAVASTAAPAADADLARTLHDAYRRLDASGRGYVPIHRLRAAVPAAREAFDHTLRRLRRDLVVDLQVGSPADYSSSAIEQSLLDHDGTLFLTVSWRR